MVRKLFVHFTPVRQTTMSKSILHLISRLIDTGIGLSLSHSVANIGHAGITLVDLLRRARSDETKSVVLHSLARHAGCWFHKQELLRSLHAAGINVTVIDHLSKLLAESAESDLLLVLLIADHLATASPRPFIKADPDLQVFNSILQLHDLESYIR